MAKPRFVTIPIGFMVMVAFVMFILFLGMSCRASGGGPQDDAVLDPEPHLQMIAAAHKVPPPPAEPPQDEVQRLKAQIKGMGETISEYDKVSDRLVKSIAEGARNYEMAQKNLDQYAEIATRSVVQIEQFSAELKVTRDRVHVLDQDNQMLRMKAASNYQYHREHDNLAGATIIALFAAFVVAFGFAVHLGRKVRKDARRLKAIDALDIGV